MYYKIFKISELLRHLIGIITANFNHEMGNVSYLRSVLVK